MRDDGAATCRRCGGTGATDSETGVATVWESVSAVECSECEGTGQSAADVVLLREVLPEALIPDDAIVTREDADALRRDLLLHGNAYVEADGEGQASHRRIAPGDIHA